MGELDKLEKVLSEVAPAARVEKVLNGQAKMDWFFGDGSYSLGGKSADIRGWLNSDYVKQTGAEHHHHREDVSRHGNIVASHLTFSEPVDAALFESCFQMLLNFRGPDLLRVKGIVNVAGMDLPMVIHGVQHVFHPPIRLSDWPDKDHSTRIVFITRNISERGLEKSLTTFCLNEQNSMLD